MISFTGIGLFLILMLQVSIYPKSSPMLEIAAYPKSSPIKVTVDFSSPIGKSAFAPGLTYVDTTLDTPSSVTTNVKELIKNGIHYENTPIMAWGLPDPWPDPSQQEPNNWSALDARLQLIHETNGVPVITLGEAPWWMKGKLQPNGSTTLLDKSEEWSDSAYASRILDNKMDSWLHLVQRVAERYMVPPYNVRNFQVWNELKGYYNPISNTYDYTTSPGDPDGPNAKHGYTYMYNLVYSKLLAVAKTLHIAPTSINVGGPYPVLDTWSSIHQSNPSKIVKAYGVYDQRTLDVVLYWLQHKDGAGFITVDGYNGNKDAVNITDAFTSAEKFADITTWIRSLDNKTYPGAKTLPIWWAEAYAVPYTNAADKNYDNAIKTYATIKFIKAGGATMLAWGGVNDGTDNTGLWTPPTSSGDSQPLPWYFTNKAFNDYFFTGTQLYKTIVSTPQDVEVLASTNATMLVNKTPHRITVIVNGSTIELQPYQVNTLLRSLSFVQLLRNPFVFLSIAIIPCVLLLGFLSRSYYRKKSRNVKYLAYFC